MLCGLLQTLAGISFAILGEVEASFEYQMSLFCRDSWSRVRDFMR
jgi:hypothetical protein